jgi:hypothetical protein
MKKDEHERERALADLSVYETRVDTLTREEGRLRLELIRQKQDYELIIAEIQ